jgi:hypothetical protein
MALEVIINGDRYIKAPPVVSAESMTEVEAVLAAPLEYEHGSGTVRSYLHDLLTTLWAEGEGFSGKRPFGNSGWDYGLKVALAKAGILAATFDEDGDLNYLLQEERRRGDRLIKQAIDYVFFGAADKTEDE